MVFVGKAQELNHDLLRPERAVLKAQGVDGGALIVHPFDPQRLYLSTRNGLRISHNGGVSWAAPVLGAGAEHELWRTTSRACVVNGKSERAWERLSAGTQTPCIGPNSEWYFLFADPVDHRILYKGGVNLCRSTDKRRQLPASAWGAS